MIKTVTVTNHLGESLILEMTRPEKSGFVVKSIEGLDPPKATINISDMGSADGGRYNSARLEKRNIVLSLGLMKTVTETIENIRHKAYKYFPPKKEIKLQIVTDTFTVETTGRVESNAVTIFSNDETATISVLCPNSYLYSTKTTETLFTGVEPMFSFPFENASSTEPLLEFGRIKTSTIENVHYDGDHDIGIKIYINAIGDATNLTIYNLDTNEQMSLNTDILATMLGTGIIAEDLIVIDTRFGQKTVTLLRDGVTYNILNCITRGSKWFTLSKGGNTFTYVAETGGENLEFRITNQTAYLGV